MNIATRSFPKSAVLKNASVHTETKSKRFSSHLKNVEELCKEWTVGRRNKAVFSNFSDTVWTPHLKLALVRNNTFSRRDFFDTDCVNPRSFRHMMYLALKLQSAVSLCDIRKNY